MAQTPTVTLPSGPSVPALGLGTWKMGEDRRQVDREIASLQRGLDLGQAVLKGAGAVDDRIAILDQRPPVGCGQPTDIRADPAGSGHHSYALSKIVA